MSITCPQCHTKCRIKNETIISDTSQGKCPECGHRFIIPPGLKRKENTSKERSSKPRPNGNSPAFKTVFIKNFNSLKTISPKTPLFWILSGSALIIILTGLLLGPGKAPPLQPEPSVTAKPYTLPHEPALKSKVTSQARSKAIAQIKHHTLVGDADISICNNHLQLILLVTDNTPAAYAERLGRQFAHYLKEQQNKNKQASEEMPVKVSVYYPGGTRIEVAIDNKSGEEEILPRENNKL